MSTTKQDRPVLPTAFADSWPDWHHQAAVDPKPRRDRSPLRWAVSIAVVTLTLLGLTVFAAVAHASAAPMPAHCTVTATLTNPGHPYDGVDLHAAGCTTPPIVTVQLWEATSADGNPLTAQVLATTAFTGPVLAGAPTHVQIVWDPDSETGGCFTQLDVAYGQPKTDLTTPYGTSLITAWHFGTRSCFWSPPPETTPPPSSTPPTTEPPATSSAPVPSTAPPVTTTPAPAPTTTADATTAPPAPTVTPSPTVSLIPPITITKAPPRKVAHHHKPRPTPTAPTPAPSTTTPVPTLPFTGTAHTTAIVAVGSAGIAFGVFCLALAAYLKRTHP